MPSKPKNSYRASDIEREANRGPRLTSWRKVAKALGYTGHENMIGWIYRNCDVFLSVKKKKR